MGTEALQQAVAKAGSQSRFAEAIGASQQIVSYWLTKDRPLPAEYVLAVEDRFGISRHALRPDVFGATPATTPRPQRGEAGR